MISSGRVDKTSDAETANSSSIPCRGKPEISKIGVNHVYLLVALLIVTSF